MIRLPDRVCCYSSCVWPPSDCKVRIDIIFEMVDECSERGVRFRDGAAWPTDDKAIA